MNIPETIAIEAEARRPAKSTRAPSAEELFEDHFDAVFRFFSRRVKAVEDAEDLAAETFAAAVGRTCPRGVAPLCWLYGIGRRKLADASRKRRVTLALDDSAKAPSPDVDGRMDLYRILKKLPDSQLEALLLQGLEDLSIMEIAAVMKRSEKSVKALLQRARERMRAEGLEALGSEVNK